MQEHKVEAVVAESRTERHEAPQPQLQLPIAGSLTFLSAEAQAQRTAELLGAGAIVVDVPPPPASMRGKLADYLDERVERALGVRGAPSPYNSAWSVMSEDDGTPGAFAARLEDQLSRARRAGASGVAIAMGSLERIAAPALTPEDSATLRVMARVAGDGSALVVMVDDGDVAVGGYGEAVGLGVMLGVGERAEADANADANADAEAEAEAEANADAEAGEHVDEVGHDESESVVAGVEVELVETKVDAVVAEKKRSGATVGVPVAGPGDFWRRWAIALGAARGPQPLGAFEKLFTESYMPLANAIAGGVDDPRALRAHDEFKAAFERAYADAFATFGASSRRPRMVMDAFDVAIKQARLHNARSTHVLVVDAMRWDLGVMVRDSLGDQAQGTASLTSESLLWSALPTTTFRQLETLARGMDALRAPATEDGSESLRGRSAEMVRRLRVGSRELYKLDVVPSMLGALPEGGNVPAALEEIAASVTDALLRHLETLPPRTLLLVLGDHGFTADRRGHITHGGATPEEVLVPCFAYLVGELH